MTEQQLGAVIAAAVKAAVAPAMERISALEAMLQIVSEKASALKQMDLAKQAEDLVARLVVLEATAPVPGPQGPAGERGEKGEAGGPGPVGEVGPEGLQGVQGPMGERGLPGKDGADGLPGKDGADGLHGKDGGDGSDGIDGTDGKDGRDGQPGVPGRQGDTGAAGLNGKDGADGLHGKDGTLEGVRIEQDDADERLVRLRRSDGSELGTFRVPGVIYREIWQAGQAYAAGDMVTLGGSTWAALKATSDRPGAGSPDWRLAVKCGRDGKDGKDGKNGLDGKDGKDRIVR